MCISIFCEIDQIALCICSDAVERIDHIGFDLVALAVVEGDLRLGNEQIQHDDCAGRLCAGQLGIIALCRLVHDCLGDEQLGFVQCRFARVVVEIDFIARAVRAETGCQTDRIGFQLVVIFIKQCDNSRGKRRIGFNRHACGLHAGLPAVEIDRGIIHDINRREIVRFINRDFLRIFRQIDRIACAVRADAGPQIDRVGLELCFALCVKRDDDLCAVIEINHRRGTRGTLASRFLVAACSDIAHLVEGHEVFLLGHFLHKLSHVDLVTVLVRADTGFSIEGINIQNLAVLICERDSNLIALCGQYAGIVCSGVSGALFIIVHDGFAVQILKKLFGIFRIRRLGDLIGLCLILGGERDRFGFCLLLSGNRDRFGFCLLRTHRDRCSCQRERCKNCNQGCRFLHFHGKCSFLNVLSDSRIQTVSRDINGFGMQRLCCGGFVGRLFFFASERKHSDQ